MPAVIRGSRRSDSFHHTNSGLESQQTPTSPTSPTSPHNRRVTFEQNRAETSNSLPSAPTVSPLRRSNSSWRRHSSHTHRRDNNQDGGNAYYDSRAASRAEYRRRGSTLQSYYYEHPELLPQLPFTFRHGFKR